LMDGAGWKKDVRRFVTDLRKALDHDL